MSGIAVDRIVLFLPNVSTRFPPIIPPMSAPSGINDPIHEASSPSGLIQSVVFGSFIACMLVIAGAEYEEEMPIIIDARDTEIAANTC